MALMAAMAAHALGAASPTAAAPQRPEESATDSKPSSGLTVAPGVVQIGRLISGRLTECSGVVASRQYPGTFWVHNDGGGQKRQVLYAISRTGQDKGEFRLADVFLTDWEDIAIDDQKHIYIADIGNNEGRRDEIAVHQLDEPDPVTGGGTVRITKSWRLQYSGTRFDAESFFVWQDHGYIVSKVFKDERAEIYRFPLAGTKQPVALESVARTKIESPVAGADLSADGKRLALVAKSGAFIIQVDGDLARANKQKGFQTKFRHDRVEGCAFVPEGLLAIAESREIFLFNDAEFQPQD
jgi:hypothetical protein